MTTEFKPRVWGQSGTGPWDKNVSLLNFYQVLPPLPAPWIGGRGSGARDSGVNLLSPPKDEMDQTQLIWHWRPSWGQGKGPRKSQEHHAGYFQADSWHGREPEITQTAGVGVSWTQARG